MRVKLGCETHSARPGDRPAAAISTWCFPVWQDHPPSLSPTNQFSTLQIALSADRRVPFSPRASPSRRSPSSRATASGRTAQPPCCRLRSQQRRLRLLPEPDRRYGLDCRLWGTNGENSEQDKRWAFLCIWKERKHCRSCPICPFPSWRCVESRKLFSSCCRLGTPRWWRSCPDRIPRMWWTVACLHLNITENAIPYQHSCRWWHAQCFPLAY